ncbi:MAG: hypothetical protein A2V88_16950 [Elusimicrobia bacterium RBG_16_66_12]|nr:MAG: hypothetical protein A2V88_16950 [Elusimicrobia bacterium RBG_16_66_12]
MDSIVERLRDLVIDPETPPEAVRLVLLHGPWVLLSSLAANSQTPAQVLEALLETGPEGRRWEMFRIAVGNPNIQVPTLEKLSWDRRDHLRCLVAECPRTPVAILERFLLDDSEAVRAHMARNDKVPPHVLERLRHDSAGWVRDHAQKAWQGRVDLTPPY